MYPVYLSAWSVNRKIVDKLFVTCPGWPQLLFQPQKQQNLLFSFFADFRKAFDRIPRQNYLMTWEKKVFNGVS